MIYNYLIVVINLLATVLLHDAYQVRRKTNVQAIHPWLAHPKKKCRRNFFRRHRSTLLL